MPQTKDQKKSIVDKLGKNLKEQKAMVFVDYQGLKASDIVSFKKKLKETGCTFVVSKKTLFKIALKNEGIDFDPKTLKGQMGLVFGIKDEVAPSKISYKFSKENEKLKILGGFFEKKFIALEDVINLASIPSREELLAKVVGSIASPISGLVNVLQGNLRGLVCVLSAINKQ
jgi:large subunit ribosomal protein L10